MLGAQTLHSGMPGLLIVLWRTTGTVASEGQVSREYLFQNKRISELSRHDELNLLGPLIDTNKAVTLPYLRPLQAESQKTISSVVESAADKRASSVTK